MFDENLTYKYRYLAVFIFFFSLMGNYNVSGQAKLSLIPSPTKSGHFSPDEAIKFNNKVYFVYGDSGSNRLVEFDGTNYRKIPNPTSGFGILQRGLRGLKYMNAKSKSIIVYNNKLYFMYAESMFTPTPQIAEFDGQSIKLIPNPAGYIPSNFATFTILGGNLYTFFASTSQSSSMITDIRLVKFDGNSFKIFDNPAGENISDATPPVVCNGKLFFLMLATVTGDKNARLAYLNDQEKVTIINNPDNTLGWGWESLNSLNNQIVGAYDINKQYFGIKRLVVYDSLGVRVINNPDAGLGIGTNYFELNGSTYFTYTNSQSKLQLAKLNGNKTELIANPTNSSIYNGISIIQWSGKQYIVYYLNSGSGKYALGEFDGVSVKIIALPDHVTGVVDGSFLEFDNDTQSVLSMVVNTSSYQSSELLLYTGSSFTKVANPPVLECSILANAYNNYPTQFVLNNKLYAVVASDLLPQNTALGVCLSSPTTVTKGAFIQSTTSVQINGQVKDVGASGILERGFVYAKWSENSTPELDGVGVIKVVDTGKGVGLYNSQLNGLIPNKSYVYRTYAKNLEGIGYSNTEKFSTNQFPILAPIAKTISVFFKFISGKILGADPLKVQVKSNILKPSTPIKIRLFSDPVTLFDGSIDASGEIDIDVEIPVTTPEGNHRIVINAIDSSGKTVMYEVPITVDADGSVYYLYNTSFSNISEGQQNVLTVGANDPEGEVLKYKIENGEDAALFKIDSISGALSFINPPDFEAPTDSNKDNTYIANVSITDVGDYNQSKYLQALIKVTDIAEKPIISNTVVENIGITGATFSANVVSDGGGGSITERGFVYAKTSDNNNPLIGGANVIKITKAGTTGIMNSTPTNLLANNAYSYKAFATNITGTTYSAVGTFTTAATTSAPVIVYNSPSIFPVSVAIAPLTPESIGTSIVANIFKTVLNFVGSTSNTSGTTDATGDLAKFNKPAGIAVDASGNVIVADLGNNKIRKITTAGVVTTIAGTGTSGSNNEGGTAILATNAKFNSPSDVSVDAAGNIFIADRDNNQIRKIGTDGKVSQFAGANTSLLGNSGSANGTGTAAKFNKPEGLAIDASGNLYIADTYNHLIRKITSAGVVSTLAGDGYSAFLTGAGRLKDGDGTAASFNYPTDIIVDNAGTNLYVADKINHSIRKISLTAPFTVSTLAGNGSAGSTDGTGGAASFNKPQSITKDGAGNLYVVEVDGNKVRKITPSGVVTTIAGSGTAGSSNGVGALATFKSPAGIAIQTNATMYVADQDNHRIRKVLLSGYKIEATPALPTGLSFNDSTGVFTGTPTAATSAKTYKVYGYNYYGTDTSSVIISVCAPSKASEIIAISATELPYSWNGQTLTTAGKYTAALTNVSGCDSTVTLTLKVLPKISYTNTPQSYRRFDVITPLVPTSSGSAIPNNISYSVTTLAGSTYGFLDDTGTNAQFGSLNGIVVDDSGYVYVSDTYNPNAATIRKISPTGVVTRFVGDAPGFADGQKLGAKFNQPGGLAKDKQGNIYVCDSRNHSIRKITPDGIVSTLAGNGIAGRSDGTGSGAKFNNPASLIMDSAGNLLVTDYGNHLIRKITPAGVVTTFAGGIMGSKDGKDTAAQFNTPYGITIDKKGNFYVTEQVGNKIRKISPTGVVTTLAGNGQRGDQDGVGSNATFSSPFAIVADDNDNLFVTDNNNRKIRKITQKGEVSTVTGIAAFDMFLGFQLVDGNPDVARFYSPAGIAIDKSNNLYVTDASRIRKITSYGYRISPKLPMGLTLNNDGSISGKPSVFAPLTTYTIVANNEYGEDSAKIQLEVVPNLPNISYTSPNIYTKNVAISPLTITNTGGVIPSGQLNKVTTIAGSTPGFVNATGTAAKFSLPYGVAVDSSGNIFVAEAGNYKIRKITKSGEVSTFAGGTSGFADGIGTAAKFGSLMGITIDKLGNLYVIDKELNTKIRKITPAAEVSTIYEDTTSFLNYNAGFASSYIWGITLDKSGNVVFTDAYKGKVFRINSDNSIATIAGNSNSGFADGKDTSAKFNFPSGLTTDLLGNIYVADQSNHKIRKITPDGMVTTLAGSSLGEIDGSLSAAKFSAPSYLTSDASGNIYVSEPYVSVVRKISTNGQVSTIAGSGMLGSIDDIGTSAMFNVPAGLAIDPSTGNIIVADLGNNRIRSINMGAFSISPELPKGLTLDSVGTISGTPIVSSPLTTYTIIGSNNDGSDTTTVDIAVNTSGTPVSPTVSSISTSAVTTTTATGSGDISNDGGAAIIVNGFVWSTSPNPTIALSTKTAEDPLIGLFKSNITGLQPNTTYYVRAYATNSIGTGYGNELSFTTSSDVVGNNVLTITSPTVILNKEYDQSTSAIVTEGILSGVSVGDEVKINATASFEDGKVGVNKKIIVTYSLAGKDAAKYKAPKNDTLLNGTISAKQLTAENVKIGKTRVYDGTTAAAVSAGNLVGVLGSDLVNVRAIARYDNKNVGTNKKLTITFTIDGSDAENYLKPVDSVITDGVITKAILTVKANNDAKFAGQTDSIQYAGVSIKGFVNGESDSLINKTGLTVTRSNNATNTAGEYLDVLVASGLIADNYDFEYINGNYTIVPADQLLVKFGTIKSIYGTAVVPVVKSAMYFKTGNSLVDLTANATVTNESVTITDGATKTVFMLTPSNATYGAGGKLKVGIYSIDTAEVSLSANVTSLKVLGEYEVSAKQLTVNASGGVSKQYDASTSMLGVSLNLNGTVTSDNVSISGKGSFNSKIVGNNKTYQIYELKLQGFDAVNYYLSGSDSLTGTNGIITAKQLYISKPVIITTKLYDSSSSAAVQAGTVIGIEKDEDALISAVANYDNEKVGTNKLIRVQYVINGFDSANYIKPDDYLDSTGIILDNQLTIFNSELTIEKVYDGNTSANIKDVSISGVMSGHAVTVSASANYEDKNAGTNKMIIVVYQINGADAMKYKAPKNDTILNGLINAKQLSVSDPIVTLSKVYDATIKAGITIGNLTGMLQADQLSITAVASYDTKNVGVNKTIRVVYTIDGINAMNYLKPEDYVLSNVGEITKSTLTVTVNDDAKFVGESDRVKYAGIRITGYVSGETISEVDTTSLMVTRSNIINDTVGNYSGVLVASGLASSNYSFSYINGNYSILPADYLLVRFNPIQTNYGKADDSISVISAKYYKSTNNALVDLTSTTVLNGNIIEVKDGATKTTFIPTLTAPKYSSSNSINVGVYTIDTMSVQLSANVIGLKVLGVVEVLPKALQVKVASGISKEYDGLTAIKDVVLTLDSLIAGDSVELKGSGNFVNSIVGSNKSYQVKDLYLSGVDATNYYVQSGLDSVVGNNGTISRKQLFMSAPNIKLKKVFDNTDSVSMFSLGNLSGVITGEQVIINASAKYASINVGKNKTITVKYTMAGSDTANYITPIDFTDTTGEIAPAQSLIVSSDSLNEFTACANDTSVVQSFDVSGNGFTSELVINAPNGFELKKGLSNIYDTLLKINPDSNGVVTSTTVFVRMKSQAVSPASGNIVITTTGLPDYNVLVKGIVNTLPTVASISGVSTMCIGTTAVLSNSTSSGIWSSNNTAVATIDSNGTVNSITAGNTTISYTVTNINGCKATVTKSLVVSDMPNVAAVSGASAVCIGTTATLSNATSGGIWSSSATSIASVSATGMVSGIAAGTVTIRYTVTNASGCVTEVTKTVTVNALPTVAAINGASAVCIGSTTTLSTTTVGGVWSSSALSIANVNTSGVVSGIAAGNAIISYTVTDANGCVAAATKSFTVNALPIVTASINNAKVNKGDNAVLSATGIGSYAWTPAANIVNPDKATTVVRVMESATYTVTVTNANGCISTASVSVTAEDNMNFQAANAFTPNGDGVNDRFVIKNIEAYPENHLLVYDRTGKLVYEARNYANTWDGKIEGNVLSKDSYFYILSVKGQVVKRGAVTLVK